MIIELGTSYHQSNQHTGAYVGENMGGIQGPDIGLICYKYDKSSFFFQTESSVLRENATTLTKLNEQG